MMLSTKEIRLRNKVRMDQTRLRMYKLELHDLELQFNAISKAFGHFEMSLNLINKRILKLKELISKYTKGV